ncbi:B3 domain-containing protein IDEF1-like isoform X2 [Telopea speciosissima]|uniref:B3 domain-containing protein IDEF1-like isoform X2 n=1 Tax=Telopea speciosissima TaxID=54955 RepID=UPI001CC5605B|nr:B3 domain-containing protein IDEF1-like isoform X2 [Telopea speciosissima]
MQSRVLENGTRAASAGNSAVTLVSGSYEDHCEEKPKINEAGKRVIDEVMDKGSPSRSSIPVPSLISVTASTVEALSMNLVQGYRVGGAGELINEQVPVLPSPTGFLQLGTSFSHGTSEVSSIFPGLNSSWCSEPVGNPYHLRYFPYNNMCFSSAAAQNLKRKVEISGSSYRPAYMESFFSHVPSGFYMTGSLPLRGWSDRSFENPRKVFMPVQAVFQNRLSPASGPQICNPSGGCTSATMHKRKVVRPSFSSSWNMAAISNGTKKDNSEPPDKLRRTVCRERNSLGVTPIGRESFALSCSEPQPGYVPLACLYKPEDDKVIEGKGWTVLVQKELRNTDVGNLGRIVLPKDAEANLPTLTVKDGLVLQMEDMNYSVIWKFKYRYWPNNRSRMYVMENTGDFVRMHNLQTGDFFIIYKEECSGQYIARGKKRMRSWYADIEEPGDHGRMEDRDARTNSHAGLEHGTSSVPSGGYEVTRAETFMAGKSFDSNRDTDGPSPTAFT